MVEVVWSGLEGIDSLLDEGPSEGEHPTDAATALHTTSTITDTSSTIAHLHTTSTITHVHTTSTITQLQTTSTVTHLHTTSTITHGPLSTLPQPSLTDLAPHYLNHHSLAVVDVGDLVRMKG